MERSCRSCYIVDVFLRTLGSQDVLSAPRLCPLCVQDQRKTLQSTHSRTLELIFKFMIVLLGLLQLMFDVIHILGLMPVVGFEIRSRHTYCLSALHMPSNVSEFAL